MHENKLLNVENLSIKLDVEGFSIKIVGYVFINYFKLINVYTNPIPHSCGIFVKGLELDEG